jgi:hypothetical protein
LIATTNDLSYHPLWHKAESVNIENSERRLSFDLLNINIEWALSEASISNWNSNFDYKSKIQKIDWPIWLLNLKVWVERELENKYKK